MLDTVKLESPEITESDALAVSKSLILRQGVELQSGEIIYAVTGGQLRGTWDASISLQVKRERVENVKEEVLGRELHNLGQVVQVRNRRTVVACPPYLWLEASVHKALLGHNVHGGPESFSAGVGFVVALAGELLSVMLPDWRGWLVRRVDWAEVYRLGYVGCEAFIRNMHGADYARREVVTYSTGVMWPGYTSALKMYMKGVEFKRHDYKRLSAFMHPDEVDDLQSRAHELVRVESELKSKKLREWNGGELPRVDEVPDSRIRTHHASEVRRVLHEGGEQVKKIRNHREVSSRLHEKYGDRLGNALYGTWSRLVLGGEAEAREALATRTFYRHRKLIKDAGCNWIGSDVFSMPNTLYPEDFRPLPSDPRRVAGEDPEVARKLAPFRAA